MKKNRIISIILIFALLLSMTIHSKAAGDVERPTASISKISLGASMVAPGGTLGVAIIGTITDNYGISSVVLNYSRQGQILSATLLYSAGNWLGTFNIPSNVAIGEYWIHSLKITDNAGNIMNINNPGLLPGDHSFKVSRTAKDNSSSSAKAVKFDTKESDSLVETIQNSAYNANITISAEDGAKIPASVFEAIWKSNRTLRFETPNAIWVFEGQNIIRAGDVDLTLKLSEIPNNNPSGGNDDAISKILHNIYGCVANFADNGILPGRTHITILTSKNGYRHFNGKKIHGWFYDSDNEKLVEMNESLSPYLDDKGYITFDITHCSSYVFTTSKPSSTKLPKKEESTPKKYTVKTQNGKAVELELPDDYVPTDEERSRFECVSSQAPRFWTANYGNDKSYDDITMHNTLQGPEFFKSVESARGRYKILNTYSIYPTKKGLIRYSNADTLVMLEIPDDVYESGRSYRMITVDPTGTPTVFDDLDDDPATITFFTHQYYAFALVYVE